MVAAHKDEQKSTRFSFKKIPRFQGIYITSHLTGLFFKNSNGPQCLLQNKIWFRVKSLFRVQSPQRSQRGHLQNGMPLQRVPVNPAQDRMRRQ